DRPELHAAARKAGLNPRTVRARVDGYGRTETEALARPVRSAPIVLADGRKLTDAAREAGLLPATVRSRLLEGWTEDRALTTPARSYKQSGP
ncbi:MAG: DsbA family protein, partial [Actinomycetia bacterium]|nr:DsbA family protein [Actinomycetes bacterium]